MSAETPHIIDLGAGIVPDTGVFMLYLMLIAGLVLLVIGGEIMVRGSIGVARRLGVSDLLIGLTLVGFGTSTPELVTSLNAALAGSPGVAIGNVAGSNIANILLIVALVALIRPLATDPKALRRDGSVMIAATVAFAVVAWVGLFTREIGFAFFAALIGYLVFTWLTERKTQTPSAQMHEGEAHVVGSQPGLWLSLGMAIGGLALIVGGADLLVSGAIDLARKFGLSETVIGLTIVAVGTSLPELTASMASALKGRSDVAIGNIIGSNIFNILGILGITAIVVPVAVPPDFAWRDMGAMGLSAGLLILFAFTGGRIQRWEGAVLLAGYIAYLTLLF
jgi:cation:H+ antiporter